MNLFDLTDLIPEFIRQMLLNGRIDANVPIYVDRDRPDEVACLLTCPLLDAACICDTLNSERRKVGGREVRVYLRRHAGGTWTRLPYGTVLTEVIEGGIRLAEAAFPTGERDLVAPPVKQGLDWL